MVDFLLNFKKTREYKLLTLSAVHGAVHSIIIIFSVVLGSLRQEFNWGLSFAGWVGTAGFALFGLTSLPAGWLADRFSKKTLLLLMAGGIIAGSFIMGLAVSSPIFIVGWLAAGFFGGMYHPLALAEIAGTYGKKSGKALAWHGSGGNITVAVTPVIAGLIASIYGWRAAFIMGGIVVTIVFFLLLAVTENSVDRSRKKQPGRLPPLKLLWILLLAHCLTGFIYRGVVTFIPSFVEQQWQGAIGLSAVGGITSLILIFGIVGQFIGGALSVRVNFWRLYLTQVGIYSLALFLTPLLSRWFFVSTLVIWGIVYYSTQPVVNCYLARFSSDRTHGRLFGLAFFINYGLGSIGAGISGQLAEYAGPLGMFWGIAFIACAVGVILWFNRSKLNKYS